MSSPLLLGARVDKCSLPHLDICLLVNANKVPAWAKDLAPVVYAVIMFDPLLITAQHPALAEFMIAE